MSYLAELVLPPGTTRITVSHVTRLLAEAIHPDLPSDAPRIVKTLAKQALTQDGQPGGHDEHLTGADRVAEEQLLASMDRQAGVAMTYETDWALLEAIWDGLPPLTLPIRETDWEKYAIAFQESPLRPDWRLVAIWESPTFLNNFARLATMVEHDKALDKAMAAGLIVPRSSLSLLPEPGITGNQLDHAFFTVAELAQYAATHHIGVTVAAQPSAVVGAREDEAMQSAHSQKIDWEFWRAMPKVWHWQACALSLSIDPDSLKQSPHSWMAGPGRGPVFESSSFPDRASEDAFDKRLRLLEAHRYDGNFFTLPMAKFSNLGSGEVLLREFAAWAASVGWRDIPLELTSLVQDKRVPEQVLAATETEHSERNPEDQAKYDKAWSLYDELEKWERMQHNNDPLRAIEIERRLASLKAEIAAIDAPSETTTPAAKAPEAAPVAGISKSQVLDAFSDLVDIDLASALEDVPKWISHARLRKGTPGGRHKTIWCPILLAVCLNEKHRVKKVQLNQAFFKHGFLKEWREQWHEQSDDLVW
ncbi:hypothetical protein [Massilia sp. PWRC2]|uniref:hypothetical protein n=1 Tax=Massilia sp. PWRC2 TaxID=2804626 RepID=UPI003CF89CBE